MVKRILVGLGDVEHSQVAMELAVDLAQRHEAEITAVTVVDHERLDNVGPVPIGGGGAANELRAYRVNLTRKVIEDAIDRCSEVCKAAGVKYRLLYEERDPFDYFISCSRYHDLMICGLHHLFEHGVIEEPPRELVSLIQSGVRPMLAVSNESRPIRKVLFAYGGSMQSAQSMRQFVQMQLYSGIEARVVSFGQEEPQTTNRLKAATEYCQDHGLEAEAESLPGPASEKLLPYANEWGADLIVMGNSSKGLLRRKLFGETAGRVMRNSNLPLFLSQ